MQRFFKSFLLLMLFVNSSYGQGLNHNYLLGYTGIDTNVTSTRAILGFTDTSMNIVPNSFAMKFRAAQSNISNSNGNLLMYTNGCYIADSTGGLMQNGDNLNPNSFTSNWCSIAGLPLPNSSVFLPFPGDTIKFYLMHLTSTDTNMFQSSELFYSVVDMTLNGGLGGVIQKNQIALQVPICPTMGACKHANGRDWWIVVMSPTSDLIYKLLLTPAGLTYIGSEHTGLPMPNEFNGTIQFSPDGNKFAYNHRYLIGTTGHHQLRILDFDRCNGTFSNPRTLGFSSQVGGYCLSFSPNSKYIYFGTFQTLFQVNSDTSNILASMDTVALQDNYCYPTTSNCTDFWFAYLAANGKIYIGSGGTAIDMHYINQPDSDGVSCDMKLHALRLPCYIARFDVYHPNYYLGPEIGSVCDSLAHVGIYELERVKSVSIKPNPSRNGNFSISYLLPQNQNGMLTVHDLFGKLIYTMHLPQWSSLQEVQLKDVEDGVYVVTVESAGTKSSNRLVIVK